MQQQHDAKISRLKVAIGRLTSREIALLVLNVRREQIVYPLTVDTTQRIIEFARRELERRR